jgi:hypothetical protein
MRIPTREFHDGGFDLTRRGPGWRGSTGYRDAFCVGDLCVYYLCVEVVVVRLRRICRFFVLGHRIFRLILVVAHVPLYPIQALALARSQHLIFFFLLLLFGNGFIWYGFPVSPSIRWRSY